MRKCENAKKVSSGSERQTDGPYMKEHRERLCGEASAGAGPLRRSRAQPAHHNMPDEYVVFTDKLTFQYPDEKRLGLSNIDVQLKKGDKLLLVGPNGAGKSTLLKILAGKKLVRRGRIELFGVNPFDLRSNFMLNDKTIVYLGTEWANNEITKRDIRVDELIRSVGGDVYSKRRDQLVDLLEIDTRWRMNRCSDGERRRVQLCMGLLKPFDLLLLDEVTIDLDVLVRQRLLQFLYDETDRRGCCIIYATHIFDGLGRWADRVVHLSGGEFVEAYDRDNVVFVDTDADAAARRAQPADASVAQLFVAKVASLYPVALQWLSRDHVTRAAQ